ncbi:MAG: oligopeptidase [Gammaproteobacteria bacterium]|jgi:oligopeptidase A|nr:oligopeptidase [Gammaproteobacteria bacterium]
MKNIAPTVLPLFSAIDPNHILAQVKDFIAKANTVIAKICKTPTPSWDTVLQPLEDLTTQEAMLWGPIHHLNSVVSTPALRAAYDEALPLWTDYHNAISQNAILCKLIAQIKESPAFETLNKAQKAVITHTLRDFHLSGVDLSDDKKELYRHISEQLATLSSKFGANVLDATKAYTRALHHEEELSGLPTWLIAETKKKKQDLPVLTLATPIYSAVMQFADHRPLREDMYVAYVTRASDVGPFAGEWDNGPIMKEILKLRNELAALLSFENYAQLSLTSKMATSTEEVLAFLNALAEKAVPLAKKEMAELKTFAKEQSGLSKLQPWDLAYYSEKLRLKKYAYSSEELRAYFPLPKVLTGLFALLEKLFSIQLLSQEKFDRWHEDALLYQVQNKDGHLHGYLYLDLYARPGKQQGAWADQCIPRYRDSAGLLHLPITFVVCNFSRPGNDTPSLLTHNDVMTLFHEFGHALHYLLTEIDEPSVSGTNGVAWDAVEFPSQLMENWCWCEEVLTSISGHYQTGQTLPKALYEKLLASKYYHCGLDLVRQLEFSLFDFHIHLQYNGQNSKWIQTALDNVRKQVAVTPIPSYNRFQNSFTHIFDGGYDAGYYSYKWAEVLSADAFQRFEQEGLYNGTLGQEFKDKILSRGGSEDAMDLFVSFMGRKPQIDALLMSLGIKIKPL